jgi:hypothetical protein
MKLFSQAAFALLLAMMGCSASAQKRCVAKEFAQYKQQVSTADGRHNIPIDYCIAEIRQRLWSYSSQPYADCAAEKEKMRDAMVGAKLHKLVKFAEDGCRGKHPLDKR